MSGLKGTERTAPSRVRAATERARSAAGDGGRRRDGALSGARAAAMTSAVVLATVADERGGPAAALPWDGGTLLSRLLGQLDGLGVARAVVLTRRGWAAALEEALNDLPLEVAIRELPDLAGDLRALGDVARDALGPIVVVQGDVVTHREALAGLLADPRIVSGALGRSGAGGISLPFRLRATRGRVVEAASPYHAADRANGAFLGALKVDPRDAPALARAADRLAELTEGEPPAGWEHELRVKAGRWRVRLARAAAADQEDGGPSDDDDRTMPPLEVAEQVELSPEDEERLARRLATAADDAAALLLVGLVRGGVHVTVSNVRRFFWARPLTRDEVAEADREIAEYDEERLLLESAVKANDGFFTTFFVSPYSKYLARWAARLGLTPNVVTAISMGIGILAALAFATGDRAGLVAGAILLQVAFTTDCVDGQLARYTRTFSKLGAWLDSVFDRAKEYVVFAGLAVGASSGFGDHVWTLAAAALTLQTARHFFDFSFAATQHRAMTTARHLPLEQPSDESPHAPADAPVLPTSPPPPERDAGAAPAGPPLPSPSPLRAAEPPRGQGAPAPRASGRRLLEEGAGRALDLWRALDRRRWTWWLRKMIVFPIGERFAVISLTAALFTPRTTFVVVLIWGGVGVLYTLGGRTLRSLAG